MTWRWAIFFSLVPAAWGGAVSGRVELSDARKAPQKDSSAVVVWLEPRDGKAEPKPGPTQSIAHRNKTFVPHLLAITPGTKVTFPNLDPFFHNAFSNYDGQVFDVGLHPPGSAREVVFRRPGIVRMFCNIHPTMSALIVVLESPYFAVTDAAGEYSIRDVPEGSYKLLLFHERVLPETLAARGRSITLGAADFGVPVITLSEAGYLTRPHKNKYDKDYPPVIVDQYPGRRP